MNASHLNWPAVEMYCRLGAKIFPVQYGSKSPLLSQDWKQVATSNVDDARRIFPTTRPFNIGIRLGPQSDICDIEVDNPEGAAALECLFNLYGEPRTVAYRSKRGLHRWFRWSPRLAALDTAVLKWAGVECRLGTGTLGAYSVVPPSLHEDQTTFYEWLPGQSPWEVPILPLPPWMEAVWENARVGRDSRSVVEVSRQGDDLIPESGQRHAYMLRMSHALAGPLRLPRDLVEEMMMCCSEYFGKVAENGEDAARKEVRDMVRTAKRSLLPEEEFPAVDFADMYEEANRMATTLREEEKKAPRRPGIPSHCVGGLFEDIATAAQGSQYSRNLVLMSMLGAVSAAIGNAATIRFAPNASPMGLQGYFVGIAGPSQGKSRAINRFLSPFFKYPGFCTDATSSALVSLLHRNPRGCVLKVTEGREFMSMLGRYSGNMGGGGESSGSDNSVFLQAWSGEPIRAARKSGDIDVPNPFLTVVCGIQPYGLNGMNVHDTIDGLSQRLLIVGEDEVVEEADPQAMERLEKNMPLYIDAIERLRTLRSHMFGAPEMRGEFDTVQAVTALSMVLNRDAQKRWEAYAKGKRNKDVLSEFPDGHPFQADLLRHAEHALRLAGGLMAKDAAEDRLTWELCNWNQTPSIWVPESVVERAIDLVEHCWADKREYLSDIADARFAKANPGAVARTLESFPEHMLKYVARRMRRLDRSRKGATDPWTLREYYRCLHITQAEAERELESMMRCGFVEHVGTKQRSNIYQFTVPQPVKTEERR